MNAAVQSMTGSGVGVGDAADGRVEAEARSVNHRHLKVSLRVTGALPELLSEVEERVRRRLARGHVTLSVTFVPAPGSAAKPGLDRSAFVAAARELAAAAAEAGLPPITAADVLALTGALEAAGASTATLALRGAAALAAVERAVAALAASRAREGAALVLELTRLLDSIQGATRSLVERAAQVPGLQRARLEQRLAELLAGASATLDPATLAREAALLADRSDVREELARLEAHVAHARQLLAEGGAPGRALDFLAQELAREANTVGSKANDLELTRTVLGLKADVERLREQVQNLE